MDTTQIRIGSQVTVSLSDAPLFTGRVENITDNGKFGLCYTITRRNGRISYVDAARIVAVNNEGV